MDELELENRASAEAYCWDPTWFGLPPGTWGQILQDAICDFQEMWGIAPDGYCGDVTIRRLLLDRLADEEAVPEELDPAVTVAEVAAEEIIVSGKRLPIKWPSVLTYEEQGGLKVTKGFSSRKKRKGRGCVIHWPVTYSPRQTVAVLNKRGYGTHFEIGPPIGDAAEVTIYQYVDVGHSTWHAVGANSLIGIDVSSPVYAKPKVLRKLARLGHTERPTLTGYRINGWRAPTILGYHENQLQALYALLGALRSHADIELAAPAHTGDPMRIKSLKSKRDIKDGVFHHAEVDVARRGKWDTAGIDLAHAVEEAKKHTV